MHIGRKKLQLGVIISAGPGQKYYLWEPIKKGLKSHFKKTSVDCIVYLYMIYFSGGER